MIEFIKVCTEAENSSPTVLLLDQYEQMVHPTITRLLNALEEVGHQSAIELIVTSQNQQRQQMERVAAQPNEGICLTFTINLNHIHTFFRRFNGLVK